MPAWSNLQKFAALACGSAGGVALYLNMRNTNKDTMSVLNSWTTNFVPSCKWDDNWDHRNPTSLVKPLKNKLDPQDENNFNEKLESKKSKVTRNIILIRHGQYNMEGKYETDRYLTEKGRLQAKATGERLSELGFKFDKMIRSTMTRAQETGKIISTSLPKVPIENCSLIEEGAPIPPEPKVGHWRPEMSQFFQDGARIEAGFRQHFHRAEPSQEEESFTLMVCHANVIRYYLCRALQFPPEAWLRLSLNHGSITWIAIHPSGRVSLRVMGEAGHMPKELLTR